MRKILFVTLTILISLFLASCNNTAQTTTGPFVGGTEGLKMTYSVGAPPDMIFDNKGYPFAVMLELQNVGEYDILEGEGMVRLIGLLPDHFGYNDDFYKEVPAIPGNKKNFDGNVLPGEKALVSFENLNYQNDLQGNQEMVFRTELCYNYQTRSSTQICIKDDVLGNINTNKICDLQGTKQVFNSGGPVHVTEVTEVPSGEHKVQVTIKVGHVGPVNGEVFKPETSWDVNSCDTSITNQEKNIVKVNVYLPENSGNAKLECRGLETDSGASTGNSGLLRLYQGMPRMFTCTIEGSDSGRNIYQELMYVDLEYAYLQYLDKIFAVQDVPNS